MNNCVHFGNNENVKKLFGYRRDRMWKSSTMVGYALIKGRKGSLSKVSGTVNSYLLYEHIYVTYYSWGGTREDDQFLLVG